MKRVLIILLNVVIFWIGFPLGLYTLGQLVDRALPPLPGWAAWAGLGPLALGVWICLHAIIVLRTRGKGLPISALPPTRFVASGPYRLLRHPIYTGYTLAAVGIGMLLGSPGLAFVVVPGVTAVWLATWVKLYEEPGLERRFGAAFRAHRRRTGVFFPVGLRRVARACVLALLRLFIRVRVTGREHVPTSGPVLIVTDHLSYLDFVFGQYISRREPLIPVTAEVFRRRGPRAFITLLGGVPKRRYCRDPQVGEDITQQLLDGQVLGIAVEGERSWTGRLGRLAPGVARAIAPLDCPVVPVAFRGSHRFWPRWAGGADRSQVVEITIGKPFDLQQELGKGKADDPARLVRVEQLVLSRIRELRAPDEHRASPADYKNPRPELTLWRCPICGAEEQLRTLPASELQCDACEARWTAEQGGLSLCRPAERQGEHHSLARWARLAGDLDPVPAAEGAAVIEAVEAELREEPADAALAPLQRAGMGQATLLAHRLRWQGDGEPVSLPLSDIRTVTTERNDTLQLGLADGRMMQLVFPRSSPLRWQVKLNSLRGEP